ncbi:MAG: arginine--tRNA ligase [Clostridia bacterium]
MKNPIKLAYHSINELINNAITAATQQGLIKKCEHKEFTIEIGKDAKNGEFAVNFALTNAKVYGLPPRALAEIILQNIDLTDTYFEKVEIAGPGFMNFYTSKSWLNFIINTIYTSGENYGKTETNNRRVMVEFISANPTGPMHMGNARGGAIGDCLAEILKWSGDTVTREFYINDAGNQIERFYKSLKARYYEIYAPNTIEFPEDGYHGDDIMVLAQKFADKYGDKYINGDEEEFKKLIIESSLNDNIEKIQKDLEYYRITFDVWFYESMLYEDGELDDTINGLKAAGCTYEKDGALWYRTTDENAEKDEVLIRANGIPTYFAADIAYHRNKFLKRNFDKVINVWGADHHGHIARLKGALSSLGIDSDKLDIVVMQLVRLISDGKPIKMSKRTGKAISLIDLLDETSVDAARYFFNMRSSDSHFDFDLDLAVEKSSENPVYYVQYAYARICSIFRMIEEDGVNISDLSAINSFNYNEPDEAALIKLLSTFPDEIIKSAKAYDPSRITRYAYNVANSFHKFYNTCKVNCEDESTRNSRYYLCLATKTVLFNTLSLLKISAPEIM